MAEAFSVDPEALSDALERMATFSKLAKALLDEIDATVKNLHISWQGAGSTAHAQAHREWTHGADQMDRALATQHQSGTGAHHNYTRAAQANRGMWS